MKSYGFEKISIVGLGYIGLPTAAMFAARRKKVIGVDVNPCAVDTINAGRIHIVEPELDILVQSVVTKGYLRAVTKPEPADAYVIAVPTPFKGDNHQPDLSFVQAASESIAPLLERGNLVILESTSPVGTTEKMVEWLAAARPDLVFPSEGCEHCDVNVAYCPERVLPGQVVRELVANDRIIGGVTQACSQRAAALYRIFVEGDLLITSARTAEMAKLTENAFRDVNIAFANELSVIAEKLGIDVWELIRLANRHPRVNILQPGCGVGGHCIAVDPWFIVDSAPDEAKLIRCAREVNDNKPKEVIRRVMEARNKVTAERPGMNTSDVCVALLGLTFKPNVDDMRESPAASIARQLMAMPDVQLRLVDPFVTTPPPDLAEAALVSLDDALQEADVVVTLVKHDAFAGLPAKVLSRHTMIDAVGLMQPA